MKLHQKYHTLLFTFNGFIFFKIPIRFPILIGAVVGIVGLSIIFSNEISANFLLLDFSNCKFKAKNFYEKLKAKGIILRSTEYGYKIKNRLRLTIGSRNDNLKFMRSVERIFGK